MESAQIPTELTLIKSSTQSFEILFLNENDIAEDLSGATSAKLAIKDRIDDQTAKLELTTENGGGLEININNSKVVATLTQTQADNLPTGIYVCDVAILFTDKWFHTDNFLVNIIPGVSSHD